MFAKRPSRSAQNAVAVWKQQSGKTESFLANITLKGYKFSQIQQDSHETIGIGTFFFLVCFFWPSYYMANAFLPADWFEMRLFKSQLLDVIFATNSLI